MFTRTIAFRFKEAALGIFRKKEQREEASGENPSIWHTLTQKKQQAESAASGQQFFNPDQQQIITKRARVRSGIWWATKKLLYLSLALSAAEAGLRYTFNTSSLNLASRAIVPLNLTSREIVPLDQDKLCIGPGKHECVPRTKHLSLESSFDAQNVANRENYEFFFFSRGSGRSWLDNLILPGSSEHPEYAKYDRIYYWDKFMSNDAVKMWVRIPEKDGKEYKDTEASTSFRVIHRVKNVVPPRPNRRPYDDGSYLGETSSLKTLEKPNRVSQTVYYIQNIFNGDVFIIYPESGRGFYYLSALDPDNFVKDNLNPFKRPVYERNGIIWSYNKERGFYQVSTPYTRVR